MGISFFLLVSMTVFSIGECVEETINWGCYEKNSEVWDSEIINDADGMEPILLSQVVEKGNREDKDIENGTNVQGEARANTDSLGVSNKESDIEDEYEKIPKMNFDGIIQGKYLLSSVEGKDADKLKSALIGLMNKEDILGKKCIIVYSPSDNVLGIVSSDKEEKIVGLNYKLFGNLEVIRDSKMKQGVEGGTVRCERLESQGEIVGKELNILSGNKFIDLTDSEMYACKACDFDGRYLYIGMYDNKKTSTFRIYDCIEPERPVLISPSKIKGLPGGNIRGVRYKDNKVYVVFSSLPEESLSLSKENLFRIIDVSDRKNPIVRGGQELELEEENCNFLDVDSERDIIYICSRRWVYSVDVSDPNNPQILDKIRLGSINLCLWTIRYQKGFLYCGGKNEEFNTLYIIDSLNPKELKEIKPVQAINLNEGIWSLDVDGDYVYIASGGSFTYTDFPKFFIIDVQDKSNPKIVSSLFITKSVCSYVKKEGDYVYLSTFHYEEDNFFTIDVRDPKNPYIVGSGRYGNMMVSLCPIRGGKYVYILLNNIERKPPFLGLMKRGGIRAGEIETDGVKITKGNTLKLGDVEITEEQLKSLIDIIKTPKK